MAHLAGDGGEQRHVQPAVALLADLLSLQGLHQLVVAYAGRPAEHAILSELPASPFVQLLRQRGEVPVTVDDQGFASSRSTRSGMEKDTMGLACSTKRRGGFSPVS